MNKVILLLVFFGLNLQAKQIRFQNLEQQTQTATNRIASFAQDHHGFIWIASVDQLWRFDGYQLKPFNHIIEAITGTKPTAISELSVDAKNNLLIGTKKSGLIVYAAKNSRAIKPSKLTDYPINDQVTALLTSDNYTWLGVENGIARLDQRYKFTYFPILDNQISQDSKITSLARLNDQKILVSSSHHLFELDINSEQFRRIEINSSPDLYIYNVRTDEFGQVWICTSKGIFQLKNDQLVTVFTEDFNYRTTDIIEDEHSYWISTFKQGLWQVSKKNHDINQFKSDQANPASLSENSLTTVFQDSHGLIWTGGFNGAVNYFDSRNLKFGLYDRYDIDQACISTDSIYDIIPATPNTVLIRTGDELFEYHMGTGICQSIDINSENNTQASSNKPLKLSRGLNHIWLASHNGLQIINDDLTPSGLVAQSFAAVYFIEESDRDHLYIGTHSGLMNYNQASQQFTSVSSDATALSTATFYAVAYQANQQPIFATNQGLASINSHGKLDYYQQFPTTFPDTDTISLMTDNNHHLWVGTYKKGLLHLDQTGQLIQWIEQFNGYSNFSVYSMLLDQQGFFWLGSDVGLIRYNPSNQYSHVFSKMDGLQGNFFNINAVATNAQGIIYMGGRNGMNVFNPNDITIEQPQQKPVFTQIKRFNEEVPYFDSGNELDMTTSIENTDLLSFDHQDYVFSIEFSALDFINPRSSQYAYILKGFDSKWNHVTAKNRSATYTNLPSGKYTLLLKSADKNGVWSHQESNLDIRVYPAPWLSWWALTAYVLFTAFIILAYIRKKTLANLRLAQALKSEVEKKTKELKTEKQTVESLLSKKNELFSHVSHEFRTPLTLILGPIKSLIEKSKETQSQPPLKMIQRNANRLLSLVEQLLQLAKVSDTNQVKTVIQQTSNQVFAIFESFLPLAANKKLDYQLINNIPAPIEATEQFLDAVLANLVSNAIKYTNPGGAVLVSADTTETHFELSVKDTGIGLSSSQKIEIFQRFKRLDIHHEIEGIGIGLAVVDEMVKINKGTIEVISEPGHGSEFIVRLPLAQATKHETDAVTITSNLALVTQLSQSNDVDLPINQPQLVTTFDSYKNNILVIEDNSDMRNHIQQVLTDHYNIMCAENGQIGVGQAIEFVPDIIICDVMMPVMDGYQVSRIIRQDQRTSHIPLMLLTALNDKTSRIKGWREHVDAYMTKPFDQEELLIQVDNMLTIRDILRNKASTELNHKTTDSVLSKTDQKFIDKIMDVIESDFKDPLLNRNKVAKKMAVSERQLQRKLKALINQNPSDLIREVRLKQAKKLLKDGYQIGLIADDCGFNSLSYFSQCFKSQYGITPKKYQQQFNH